MLAYELLGSRLGIGDNAVCLRLCVRKNCVLVGNDLLITLDLIRSLKAQLTEKLLQLFLVYNDLGRGQRLEFATVYLLFDLLDDLLYSAAHTFSLLQI